MKILIHVLNFTTLFLTVFFVMGSSYSALTSKDMLGFSVNSVFVVLGMIAFSKIYGNQSDKREEK